jgi:hypothetical protein
MLFQKYPDLNKTWDDYRDFWDVDPSTGYHYMTAFTFYVIEVMRENKNDTLLKDIFNFAELLMVDGSPEVNEAVATCFLENLINNAAGGRISTSFVFLLGPESKAYCRGWDEFCGDKTEGLWDD